MRKTNYIYEKATFTEQEKNILFLIAEALSSSQIAERLKVSKRTIDTHRANLMQKLNFKTLPELIRFAVYYSIKYSKNNKIDFQY